MSTFCCLDIDFDGQFGPVNSERFSESIGSQAKEAVYFIGVSRDGEISACFLGGS